MDNITQKVKFRRGLLSCLKPRPVLFIMNKICLNQSYKSIGMKCYGGVLGSTVKDWLNFGGDVGILR